MASEGGAGWKGVGILVLAFLLLLVVGAGLERRLEGGFDMSGHCWRGWMEVDVV